MYDVRDTPVARGQFAALPLPIQARVAAIYQRLTHWPDVSGAKPMRKDLHGAYRVRTGDYRVLFRVDATAECILVFRIANRRDVYE
jgi:mRNA interferase RelE/StbE